MMICVMLQASVAAFVLLNNMEINRRPSKRVTVIIESIKNGFEVLRITPILRIEVHEDHEVFIIGDAFQYVISDFSACSPSLDKISCCRDIRD